MFINHEKAAKLFTMRAADLSFASVIRSLNAEKRREEVCVCVCVCVCVYSKDSFILCDSFVTELSP